MDLMASERAANYETKAKTLAQKKVNRRVMLEEEVQKSERRLGQKTDTGVEALGRQNIWKAESGAHASPD